MANVKSFKINGTDSSIYASDIGVKNDDSSTNFNIGDDNGNVIIQFNKGHIKTQNFDSNFIKEDISNADFNIGDENGNVIVQFQSGHIKTKKFNSININSSSNESTDTKTVDLIIFMGQSNMSGRGSTSTTWPATAPTIIDGAGYEYRAVSDPSTLYPISEPFGVNENRGEISETNKTGSMVTAFVNSYYTKCKVPVIGVSASKGGTSTALWQPDGTLLPEAIARLTDAISYLTTNDYTIAHKYMVWCQGCTDGDDGVSSETYINNFENIWIAMQEYGIEKCFIVRIGEINSAPYTQYDNIIQAQTDMCKDNEDLILISTEFASFRELGLMKDTYHYYQEGYNRVGTHAGANAAEYRMYNKAPIMYDPKTDDLYFSTKSY